MKPHVSTNYTVADIERILPFTFCKFTDGTICMSYADYDAGFGFRLDMRKDQAEALANKILEIINTVEGGDE